MGLGGPQEQVRRQVYTKRKLPETRRAVALLFNGIQRSRSKKVRVLGVQAQMRTFDYFYGLRLGILLLRHSVNLSASLQTKDLCAGEAQTIAKNTVATLTKVRTYENYHLFWEDVKQEAAKLYIDAPKLPTRKKHEQEWKNSSVEKQHLNTPMMLFPTSQSIF